MKLDNIQIDNTKIVFYDDYIKTDSSIVLKNFDFTIFNFITKYINNKEIENYDRQ